MKKTLSKIFLTLFSLSFLLWLGISTYRTLLSDHLLQFGTAEFKTAIDPDFERQVYHDIAKYSVVIFIVYPIAILTGIGYLITTEKKFKNNGWLLMCTILFFIFVPVEAYCAVLDWKIVGLNYWGEWPIEEFRKAFLKRITVLSGAPFLAALSYYTIVILAIWQPMKRKDIVENN